MQQQPTIVAGPADELPGVGDYVSIVRKRKRLLFLVGLPIVALGGLLALGLPDIYSSSGLIEIEGAESVKQGFGSQNGTLQDSIARESDEPLYADQYVQSLSTAVLSDKNLSLLLAKQPLYEDQAEDRVGEDPGRRRGPIRRVPSESAHPHGEVQPPRIHIHSPPRPRQAPKRRSLVRRW